MANLDFEKPILEIDKKIDELKSSRKKALSSQIRELEDREIHLLEEKREALRKEIFSSLTPWQKVQIARHSKRPYTLDYIGMLMTDFVELHGDRFFSDDKALIGGFARFAGRKVMVMGHQKGRDLKENLLRNFGCAHPEGYRKALRLMQLAARASLPIVIFIDTPGAYPGIGAEERGQAQAIATNLREMVSIPAPIVAVVIGEGGSGGALGIGVADRVFVLENSYYSVISPEGCAAILWKSSSKAPEAAEALKMTAKELLALGIIDGLVPEPLGGAHVDPAKTAAEISLQLTRALDELQPLPPAELLKLRYRKYRDMGSFRE